MAWTRKILRVDLGAGTCTPEPLNMAWANEYLGQRGLATKYLSEEIDPQCDALGPDNKLIMATGPLTGTMASTGGRYSVITKSPLTGLVACSQFPAWKCSSNPSWPTAHPSFSEIMSRS